jgi:uncharacterized protein (DUF305 family)
VLRAAVGLVVAAAVSVVVAGSSGPDRASPRAGDGAVRHSPVRVIIPGRPGESAAVASSDEIPAPDGSSYGAADATFVRMMIPHHLQAVEMAALAPTRASNPKILAIAGRIRAGQIPEVAQLRAWLRARGLSEDDGHAGHDHAAMRGLQTPAAMRALAAARGGAFDRMFVTMMSAHHQGAVEMAAEVLAVVKDIKVEEIATYIATEQAIEITRLRELIGG